VHEEDGTKDYLYTSEEWLFRIQRALASPRGLEIAARAFSVAARAADQFATMAARMLLTQSCSAWQLQGTNPPMRQLRQTWVWNS